MSIKKLITLLIITVAISSIKIAFAESPDAYGSDNYDTTEVTDAPIYSPDYCNQNALIRLLNGETNLVKAELEGVSLEGHDLSEINFRNANLQDANLSYTNLTNTNFRNADLEEANLKGANIKGASFRGANLEYATWVDGQVCAEGSIGVCK